MTDDINAIDLLKEEMQTEDIHLKVNAVHRLKTVVLSIGQSDTVNQLLPYLESKQALQTYKYSTNKPGR
jgi:serine/threonine-protein phosphatase 2A regulatory subunit A